MLLPLLLRVCCPNRFQSNNFHNAHKISRYAQMTSRNAHMTSRFSVPASAGPLLPLPSLPSTTGSLRCIYLIKICNNSYERYRFLILEIVLSAFKNTLDVSTYLRGEKRTVLVMSSERGAGKRVSVTAFGKFGIDLPGVLSEICHVTTPA